ncbi:MAG: chemotaxis protein CheW [Bacteroidales bacterium]
MITNYKNNHSKESYFTFIVKDEFYAAPVKNIDCLIEIPTNLQTQTKVPFIIGHTIFHNKKIPIIDLAKLLGLGPSKISRRSCLIVLRILENKNNLRAGIIADSTYEYREVDVKDIAKETAENLTDISEYIAGVIADRMLHFRILDSNKIVRNTHKHGLEPCSR